jgi:predicted secreted acid phosphatase
VPASYQQALDWQEHVGLPRIDKQIYAHAAESLISRSVKECQHVTCFVILDLDETVLDNLAYLKQHPDFDAEAWAHWEATGLPKLVPGAETFLNIMHQRGVKVAFVTNRRNHQGAVQALKVRGLLAKRSYAFILTRTGDANKHARFVAARHIMQTRYGHTRLLAAIGDNDHDNACIATEECVFYQTTNPLYGTRDRRFAEWRRSVASTE